MRESRNAFALERLSETLQTDPAAIRTRLARIKSGITPWSIWKKARLLAGAGARVPSLNTLIAMRKGEPEARAESIRQERAASAEVQQLLGPERYEELNRRRQAKKNIGAADASLLRRINALKEVGVDPRRLNLRDLEQEKLQTLLEVQGTRAALGPEHAGNVEGLISGDKQKRGRRFAQIWSLLQEDFRKNNVDPRKVSALELVFAPAEAIVAKHRGLRLLPGPPSPEQELKRWVKTHLAITRLPEGTRAEIASAAGESPDYVARVRALHELPGGNLVETLRLYQGLPIASPLRASARPWVRGAVRHEAERLADEWFKVKPGMRRPRPGMAAETLRVVARHAPLKASDPWVRLEVLRTIRDVLGVPQATYLKLLAKVAGQPRERME